MSHETTTITVGSGRHFQVGDQIVMNEKNYKILKKIDFFTLEVRELNFFERLCDFALMAFSVLILIFIVYFLIKYQPLISCIDSNGYWNSLTGVCLK